MLNIRYFTFGPVMWVLHTIKISYIERKPGAPCRSQIEGTGVESTWVRSTADLPPCVCVSAGWCVSPLCFPSLLGVVFSCFDPHQSLTSPGEFLLYTNRMLFFPSTAACFTFVVTNCLVCFKQVLLLFNKSSEKALIWLGDRDQTHHHLIVSLT